MAFIVINDRLNWNVEIKLMISSQFLFYGLDMFLKKISAF